MIQVLSQYKSTDSSGNILRGVSKRFYVYLLLGPSRDVVYVGKGQGARAFVHISDLRCGCTCNKCNHLRGLGCTPDNMAIQVIFETDNEQEAFDHEWQVIEELKTPIMANFEIRRLAKQDTKPE